VMFIPKPRKANYTQSRAYCPINLLSFMLKVTEKLVQQYIRDKILRLPGHMRIDGNETDHQLARLNSPHPLT